MASKMPKTSACPACGKGVRCFVFRRSLTELLSHDRPREVCSECGLPVALFPRFAAAMELASDPAWGIGGCVATGLGSALSCHESLHGAMERLSRLARRARGAKG